MAHSVIFSSLAQIEVQEAYSWYEDKQRGLGERFVDIIEEAIRIISNTPESFPVKVNQFRQYPLLKFPYVVIYEFDPKEDVIYVLHIFNTYQDPNKKLKPR